MIVLFGVLLAISIMMLLAIITESIRLAIRKWIIKQAKKSKDTYKDIRR